MLKIAQLLLKKNAIVIDKEEFVFQIQSHPSYPSMHAITGVYTHFNIENVAATVPVEQEVLSQLPNAYVAQINDDKGLELVLVEKEKGKIRIHDSEGDRIIEEEKFLKIFTGIILAVEKDENSEVENKKTSNIFIYTILSALFIGLIVTLNFEIFSFAYLLLSFVGVVISLSILNQEVGINNSINNLFCTSKNEKKDCDAVLTSNGAKIFKNHKLSDLSFIYFLGLFLAQFVILLQSNPSSLLYGISVLALPITLYSIYYQYAVVKKWCFLCLSIVALLWIQGSVFFIQSPEIVFSLEPILVILFGFVLGYSIWSFTKPKFTQLFDLKKVKIDHFKFKRNFNLFNTLLSSSETINANLKDTSEIVFGNKNSALEIVVITNPFCGHCKPVHKLIESVLKAYPEEVGVTVRFNINVADETSDGTLMTQKLIELYHEKGEEICLEAMHDAYGVLSPDKWFDKWGKTSKPEYLEVLKNEKEWCTDHKINFTPEILINGNSFPKEYDRQDLLYFVEELHENCNVLEETPQTV
jgi:uncharacterized membrane protein